MAAKRTRNIGEHVIATDKFGAAFQFSHYSFNFSVNYIELTEEFLNLLTLDKYSFETDTFLHKSQMNFFFNDEAICQYG